MYKINENIKIFVYPKILNGIRLSSQKGLDGT